MGAGRIAGVAGGIAVIAIGAFLLWSVGAAPRPAAPRPAQGAAPGAASAEGVPDAAAPGAAPSAPAGTGASAAPATPAPTGAGSITGRLVYSDDQAPAPGVLVVLFRGPEGSKDEVGRIRSDEQGRFAFAGLAAGEHAFSTLAAEGEMWDHEHETATVAEGNAAEVGLWVERPLPPGTGIRVTGTVKYEDGRAAGRFRFTLHLGTEGYRVESENGAWERRLPRAGKYRLWSARADRQDWEDLDLEVEIAEGVPLDLVLPLPRDAVLVVVARDTGAPLPTARLYRLVPDRFWLNFSEHPGPATLGSEPLRADAQGRISLGPGLGGESVYVVADGYAWKRAQADHGRDGPRRVVLDPGGSMRLTVSGWDALVKPTISLVRTEPWTRWTLPPPAAGGQATYTNIPAGTWTVLVRRGAVHDDGEVYGEVEATVAAGAETEVSIAARASVVLAPVGVVGTVTLPAAWKRAESRLDFVGAEPTNVEVRQSTTIPIPPDGAPAPFVLKPVPPGLYHVTLEPPFYETVTVSAEGGVFHFKVPPPATLIVRVVDAATDAPVEGSDCWWSVPSGRNSYSLEEATKGDAPGTWRVVVPAGTVRLQVEAPGYSIENLGDYGAGSRESGTKDGVAVAAGVDTEITVRMKRAGGLKVVFRYEGDPPDWDEMEVNLVRTLADGEEDWQWMEVGKGVATTDQALPGDWELRVEELGDEFEPVAPRAVTLVASETATLEVPLVRKK